MEALDIIRLVGDEFSGVSDAVVGQWIELARPFVSKKVFGKLFEQALAYFTCHMMKISGNGVDLLGDLGKMGGSAGVAGIQSISDGGSSISFAWSGAQAVTSAEMVLSETVYGRQYLAIARLVVVPITIDH